MSYEKRPDELIASAMHDVAPSMVVAPFAQELEHTTANADAQTFVFERFASVHGATGLPKIEYATPGPLVAM